MDALKLIKSLQDAIQAIGHNVDVQTPIVEEDEYVALGWPEIQEYMESARWDEVGYDPKKDLWFVSKNMVYEGK